MKRKVETDIDKHDFSKFNIILEETWIDMYTEEVTDQQVTMAPRRLTYREGREQLKREKYEKDMLRMKELDEAKKLKLNE